MALQLFKLGGMTQLSLKESYRFSILPYSLFFNSFKLLLFLY